ncbi:MAG: SDR family NAD(P)-dependent oxidoreductase, partial [Myxococcales bacterium]
MGMGIEMTDLKGRIAVVTGASRGIGKGIALALGERGCIVYVTRQNHWRGRTHNRHDRARSDRVGR